MPVLVGETCFPLFFPPSLSCLNHQNCIRVTVFTGFYMRMYLQKGKLTQFNIGADPDICVCVCVCVYTYILLRVNEQRNILREIRKRKANWTGHILRRNCLLKQVIGGKIKGEMDVTRRRGRRRKKLLDALKDRRGYSYLKEEALDRTMCRNRFGRGFGPVVRQTAY